MKRILYIESGATGGGSFASLLLNLTYLNRDKYTPIAVFLNDTPHKKKAEALGITTYLIRHPFYGRQVCYRRRLYRFLMRVSAHYVPALYLLVYSIIHHRLIHTLKRIISKHDIEIVHLNNNVIRDLFGVLLSKQTGATCISHLRAAPGRQAHARRLNGLTNDLVFAYIAISRYVQERWTTYGLDVNKCHVIHNGIPSLHVNALDVRREFDLHNVRTVICSVGRLVEWKNQSFLIRAFAEYRKQDPSSALLLVGEGPERPGLERVAHDLGVAPYVVFVGHSEQAKEILAGSDIFVLPSREEPFGRVTLEAMALKVPVIATSSGGSVELVSDNETGLIVALNDIQQLCSALWALSEDKELRTRLIRNAYEATQKEFHIDNCVTAIEKIYGEI